MLLCETLENESALSYPYLTAISIMRSLLPRISFAASVNLLRRIYSLSVIPVI